MESELENKFKSAFNNFGNQVFLVGYIISSWNPHLVISLCAANMKSTAACAS